MGFIESRQSEARDRAFVGRMYRMRMLGLVLSGLAVAAVLHENGTGPLAWALLLLNVAAWPHLALWRARRSRMPREAELRNLVLDSALGGAWVAVMQFNLLPSVLLMALLTVDKVGVGGWRFLGRTLPPQFGACLLVSALLGFPVQLESSMAVVVASLPFLVGYPLALSAVMYALAHRVAQQNRQLERLNRIDVLTGLPNRRHWDEVAGSELARYLRSRRPAVVMLIDLDNFKEVNDAHGHAAGDEVLRRVAQVLRESVREIDTPARYGGDEFVVLLTEADVRGARDVAERVRTRFLEIRGEAAVSEHCTLSIGLAQADRLLVNADDWVRRADAAMYGAKAGGRDRVNVA
ncbi:sensor domain-containing diguanylate cyclase [Luteimonas lutimaris]|uniref:diguanylate cyclase n=2 Tax=Luteimonas lutimaris TaxID=698645 RepID=A0ABP7MYS0_9GAMM